MRLKVEEKFQLRLSFITHFITHDVKIKRVILFLVYTFLYLLENSDEEFPDIYSKSDRVSRNNYSYSRRGGWLSVEFIYKSLLDLLNSSWLYDEVCDLLAPIQYFLFYTTTTLRFREGVRDLSMIRHKINTLPIKICTARII